MQAKVEDNSPHIARTVLATRLKLQQPQGMTVLYCSTDQLLGTRVAALEYLPTGLCVGLKYVQQGSLEHRTGLTWRLRDEALSLQSSFSGEWQGAMEYRQPLTMDGSELIQSSAKPNRTCTENTSTEIGTPEPVCAGEAMSADHYAPCMVDQGLVQDHGPFV